ncbi:MAG: hypothetical protein QW228_08910 [Candidatus Aenigmatarchaeota archaeon]
MAYRIIFRYDEKSGEWKSVEIDNSGRLYVRAGIKGVKANDTRTEVIIKLTTAELSELANICEVIAKSRIVNELKKE